MSLGFPFINRITTLASCELSGICFVFSMLLKMFVRLVRTICPPSFIISLVIPSRPWGLYLYFFFFFFKPFSWSFLLLLCKLGYFFCVWTWFHCTFLRGHFLVIEWFVEICAYIFSPDSFLKLIVIRLFLYLLIWFGPFRASNVSCVNSFLFLRVLVLRFFFTNFVEFCILYLVLSCLLCVAVLSFSYLNFQFLYLQHSIMDFCVSFCMRSIDSFRILFMFSVVGSLSFKTWNLFFFLLQILF